MAYNVRTLSRRLSFVLPLPFSLLCLTEVRAPPQAIRSLSRVIASAEASSIWSSAPPPSPTFLASPGGVCLIAKRPWTISPLHVPALLHWSKQARLCVGKLSGPTLQDLAVFCIYGFPDSHAAKPTNECMIRDVISCASGMICPAIVCGDLNETLRSSAALTACERLGMVHVSPNTSTTRRKNGEVMKGEAIDHILVNRHALHFFPTSTILVPRITLSDHFPLTLSLMLPREQDFISMKWPMPAKDLRVIEAYPYQHDQKPYV